MIIYHNKLLTSEEMHFKILNSIALKLFKTESYYFALKLISRLVYLKKVEYCH